MGKDQTTPLRRMFPTAHKLLLDRELSPRFRRFAGAVLVVGAGKVDYRRIIPNAASLCATDIEAGPGIDLVADAHALPFPDGSFDAAVAIEVFEHLRDPAQAARELYRVLRPGGVALVSVPFLFRVHADPYDFQRFTGSGLKVLFGGFRSCEVSGFGNRVHVFSDLLTTVARPAAALRLANHLLTFGPLGRPSADAPSGYVVVLHT